MCHARNQDPCAFLGVIPNEMFFQCPDTAQFTNWFTNYSSWYYILWYVSSIWICSHIWIPKSQRLASTEQMFGRPYYDGLILEQDILLNKRSDSGKIRFRLDVNRAPRYALNIHTMNLCQKNDYLICLLSNLHVFLLILKLCQ